MEHYKTFIKQISEGLADKGCIVKERTEFKEDPSGNRINDRLSIVIKGSISESSSMETSIALPVYQLYMKHMQGNSVSDIITQLQQCIEEKLEMSKRILDLEEFNKASSHLFVRPLNILELGNINEYIFKLVGDIALVVYYSLEANEQEMVSVRIHKSSTEKWNMSEEEIYQYALLNTYYFSPPRMFDVYKVMADPEGYNGEGIMNLLTTPPNLKATYGIFLTTEQKINGAISIFLPGVAQRVAALMNAGFYICFPSKHEAALHSLEAIDPSSIKKILRSSIQEKTEPEDFLSYRVYKYEPELEEIICLDPFAIINL